jgi:hypothetical protein
MHEVSVHSVTCTQFLAVQHSEETTLTQSLSCRQTRRRFNSSGDGHVDDKGEDDSGYTRSTL